MSKNIVVPCKKVRVNGKTAIIEFVNQLSNCSNKIVKNPLHLPPDIEIKTLNFKSNLLEKVNKNVSSEFTLDSSE